MPFFAKRTMQPKPQQLTFALADAGLVYDDGTAGLNPTSLTIAERRVAVIGLNGTGTLFRAACWYLTLQIGRR